MMSFFTATVIMLTAIMLTLTTQNANASAFDLSIQNRFMTLIDQASNVLRKDKRFNSSNFNPNEAVTDGISTTLKYNQFFKGIEVVGEQAQFHYDIYGTLVETTGGALDLNMLTTPTLSVTDAQKILADRYQQEISLSEPADLKVIKDYNDNAKLTWHFLTASTQAHDGSEIFMDAHTGEILIEAARDCTLTDTLTDTPVKITIYDANTEKALAYTNPQSGQQPGAPTKIDLAMYKIAVRDRMPATVDASAKRAFENSVTIYDYYKSTHSRLSYDDKDTRLTSVVHMGKNYANAFWSNEYKIMAYGDGNGKNLIDLTFGLDVAGHEVTHAVTSTTAKLIYAGESGALNESFSDIFGKMIDYDNSNWYIGGDVIGPDLKNKGIRGIRSMSNPEEYKQPATMDSTYYKPASGSCVRKNDMCWVHKNSGVPNRVAYEIIMALGKQDAEKLFYNVLTQRLSASAKFVDFRKATASACSAMFGSSAKCQVVESAFDAAKIGTYSPRLRTPFIF